MRYYILIVLIIAGDQLSKWFIISELNLNESIPIINGAFHITYIRNTGAAFSLLEGHAAVLGVVTAVLIVGALVFVYLKRKTGAVLMMSSVSMIIGGGAGNLVDRAVYGYVVDFIDFRVFPIFNVADICVTLGCALLCIYVLKAGGKEHA